jgi:hypothetical protein
MVDYVGLLKSVLVVLVAWLLKLFLATIGVEIDPVLFNTLVAAIVAYLLALFVHATGQNVRASFIAKRSLKQ